MLTEKQIEERIAYAISRREDVDSCIVICRKYSTRYFIKLEMKLGNVYGRM